MAHETKRPAGAAFENRKAESGKAENVITDSALRDAETKAALCREFQRLTVSEHLSLNQAATALGKSPSWFSGEKSPYARWLCGGVAALVPDRRASGSATGDLTAEIEALGWFIPAARFFNLNINRTLESGSVPEAIRRTISLPELPVGWTNAYVKSFLKAIACGAARAVSGQSSQREDCHLPVCPPELREKILAREKAGQPFVPERIARQITLNKATVWQHRRPHEAGLKYLQAPGTAMMVRGEHGNWIARAGDILEADDGSINFPVCIPWRMADGSPITESVSAQKFGVIVGRFQWLRTIDAGSRYRPGWVFVARSRGSYRGADVLTLLRGLTLQHGVWGQYRFERGVWKSNLVKEAIKLLGADLRTVHSPHSKAFIEGGFNQDWTKLSVHFPHCDLGRWAGDTEETNKVIQGCRAGATDPRRHFPMLADALKAFDIITQEENRTPVNTRNHGRWIPEERWQTQLAERPARKLEERMHFLFEPYALEWKVRGMTVGGRVPLFEDMSVPFDFTAPWLHQFDGAKLRLHFDPSAPKCFATPVLLENFNGRKVGEILEPLHQVNEVTGYIRMVLGWGEDPSTAGLKAKQAGANALRRELRTVMPGGGKGYGQTVITDGIAQTATIEGSSARAASVAEGSSARAASGDSIQPSTNPPIQPSAPRTGPDRAAQAAELAEFERNNQHLFV